MLEVISDLQKLFSGNIIRLDNDAIKGDVGHAITEGWDTTNQGGTF